MDKQDKDSLRKEYWDIINQRNKKISCEDVQRQNILMRELRIRQKKEKLNK